MIVPVKCNVSRGISVLLNMSVYTCYYETKINESIHLCRYIEQFHIVQINIQPYLACIVSKNSTIQEARCPKKKLF